MSDVIISVENLGKKYVLSHQGGGGYRRFSERLEGWIKKPFNALAAVGSRISDIGYRKAGTSRYPISNIPYPSSTEEFWALKGVSFEVKRGEVVGIIGRNGAGKSTLLKILSRITEPTEGRVTLRGRVASLLEVGTGFHPELTGRENIFLNGAILGMTKAEIKKKFDEIVAFAEVERFLDTPVKRYSSGMYVRLAFAVAAHLEPEILVVDEVLAVGDAEFQKKCLGKMKDVATGGRTVLFVSHNMAAVTGLCGSAVWLENGCIRLIGNSRQLVSEYLTSVPKTKDLTRLSRRHVGEDIKIEKVELLVNQKASNNVQSGQTCAIRVHYSRLNKRPTGILSLSIMLYSEGQKLVNLWTNCHPEYMASIQKSSAKGYVDCIIDKWPFRSRSIRVDVFSHTSHATQDWVEEALVFDSHDGDFYKSGIITNPDQGIMFLPHSWRFYALE